MQFFSLMLFGISANLDALLIGASYGFRKIHLLFRHNLLISLITFLGSFLSIGLGRLLEKIFPDRIIAGMGSILLILFGVYLWRKSLRAHQAAAISPEKETYGKEGDAPPMTITVAEAVILGFILSANNVGIGFSLGMTGIPLMPAMSITLLLSLLFLTLGNRLGTSRTLQLFAVIADPLSGILLICLGILELFVR